ncbi:MAG: hypothetical protein AAGF23_08750 [Acidobacteriota bacterium]
MGRVPGEFPSGVTLTEGSFAVPFVESIEKIEHGPICGEERIDSWVIDNGLVKVEATPMGGSVLSIQKSGHEYLWRNRSGAAYAGAGSETYPLTRGLLQPGGVRLCAVAPEHGLYYDSDWDIDFTADGRGSSIVLAIRDSQENRDLLGDTLSYGFFSVPGSPIPMGRYPVTDAEFRLRITLRPREAFVRLTVSLVNPGRTSIRSEVWLSQTYPIDSDSRIISHQKKRRCKDPWVYETLLDGKFQSSDMALDAASTTPPYVGASGSILRWPPSPIQAGAATDLDKPLDWPSSTGGILYDYPHRDGAYHAVSFGDGRGAAYVTHSDAERPHYTKMWSWGDRDLYDRQEALRRDPPLLGGRPTTEYYEPWGSAFTPAFFEPTEFPPGESSWHALIVPIESGLDRDTTSAELRRRVDEIVDPLVADLP